MQVLKETKQLCASAVEPLVNSVDAVKQYGIDKVVAVLSAASSFVLMADRNYQLCFSQFDPFFKSIIESIHLKTKFDLVSEKERVDYLTKDCVNFDSILFPHFLTLSEYGPNIFCFSG